MKKYSTLYVSLLFIISFFCGENVLKAQLSFPQSNTLNLETNLDYLYFETMIKFNTGHYRIYDYKYEKIYDSIDKNWFVTACFNGDCHNALEQSGNFNNILGNSDTTGFIAFHVESNDSNGRSDIAYRVVNTKDTADHAVLTFHIQYTYVLGLQISSELEGQTTLFPNPTSGYFSLSMSPHLKNPNPELQIFSSDGRLISNENLLLTDKVNISRLSNGLCYVRVIANGKSFIRPLMVEK